MTWCLLCCSVLVLRNLTKEKAKVHGINFSHEPIEWTYGIGFKQKRPMSEREREGEDKHKKGDKNEKPIIQKAVEKRE